MNDLKNSLGVEDEPLSTFQYLAGGALILGVLGFVYAITKTAKIYLTVTKWRDARSERSEKR